VPVRSGAAPCVGTVGRNGARFDQREVQSEDPSEPVTQRRRHLHPGRVDTARRRAAGDVTHCQREARGGGERQRGRDGDKYSPASGVSEPSQPADTGAPGSCPSRCLPCRRVARKRGSGRELGRRFQRVCGSAPEVFRARRFLSDGGPSAAEGNELVAWPDPFVETNDVGLGRRLPAPVSGLRTFALQPLRPLAGISAPNPPMSSGLGGIV